MLDGRAGVVLLLFRELDKLPMAADAEFMPVSSSNERDGGIRDGVCVVGVCEWRVDIAPGVPYPPPARSLSLKVTGVVGLPAR